MRIKNLNIKKKKYNKICCRLFIKGNKLFFSSPLDFRIFTRLISQLNTNRELQKQFSPRAKISPLTCPECTQTHAHTNKYAQHKITDATMPDSFVQANCNGKNPNNSKH